MKVLIGTQKAKTIEFIKFVVEQAEVFDTNFRVYAIDEQAKFEERLTQLQDPVLIQNEYGIDDDEFNKMLETLGDKDALVQMLDTSKEYMDNFIGGKEGEITKSISKENETREKMIKDNQHSRNRSIVKEIISTCETFRNEIKEDFAELKPEDYDG